MQSFSFHSPTEVIFGKGAEGQAARYVKKYGGSRVLVVYGGGSVIRSGLMDRITGTLEKEGLAFALLGGVQPNPRLSFARDGVRKAIDFGADFILAVGGGSAIDTAKGIAHGAANPDTDIWAFWTGEKPLEKSLPVGVVLTLSAAGSETSDSAVLTNEETGAKRGLSCGYNRPKFAAMNPELTYTLPYYQVACGITDIMMHTLDRYFTLTEGNELTDEIAESVLRVAIRNGKAAMRNKEDYQAMSELMWCGSISHNSMTGLGAVIDFVPHKLGHELSAMFDVAHGASLSAVWDSWARYSYQVKPERFARYADKVWGIQKDDTEEAALSGIVSTAAYFRSIGMPTNFTDLGIGVQPDETLRELARRAMFHGRSEIGGFRVLGQDDVYEIYKLANH